MDPGRVLRVLRGVLMARVTGCILVAGCFSAQLVVGRAVVHRVARHAAELSLPAPAA